MKKLKISVVGPSNNIFYNELITVAAKLLDNINLNYDYIDRSASNAIIFYTEPQEFLATYKGLYNLDTKIISIAVYNIAKVSNPKFCIVKTILHEIMHSIYTHHSEELFTTYVDKVRQEFENLEINCRFDPLASVLIKIEEAEINFLTSTIIRNNFKNFINEHCENWTNVQLYMDKSAYKAICSVMQIIRQLQLDVHNPAKEEIILNILFNTKSPLYSTALIFVNTATVTISTASKVSTNLSNYK